MLRKETVPRDSRPNRLRKRGSMVKVYLRGEIANLLPEEVGLNVEGLKVEGKIRNLVFTGILRFQGKIWYDNP